MNKENHLKLLIQKHPYVISLILSLFVATFAAFFFFSSVSPLFSGVKGYSYDVGSVDSNYFMYTGKKILEGKLPYLGFFDHKGVLVFYFNALGMLIGGRMGVLLLNLVLTFVTCFLISLAAREINDNSFDMIIAILIFFVCLTATEGGNQNGFMSLPFVPIPFIFYLRAMRLERNHLRKENILINGTGNKISKQIQKKIKYYYLLGSFAAGFEIGIAFNVRPSDGVICACLFVCYFIQCIKHHYGIIQLLFNALSAILGFAIPLSIIWSIAYVQGYFEEMINAVFIQSSKYAFGFSSGLTIFSQILILIWTVFAVVFNVLILVSREKKYQDLAIFFLTISILNSIPNMIYAKYVQYWFTSFPYMVLMLVFLLRVHTDKVEVNDLNTNKTKISKLKKFVILFSAIFPLIGGVGTTGFYYSGAIKQYSYKYSERIKQEIKETIPKEAFKEKDNVYCLNVNAALLLWVDDNTSCKYQSYQSWHSAFDPYVESAVYSYLYRAQPEYIIKGTNGEGLDRKYSFIVYIENNYNDVTPKGYTDTELTIYKSTIS